MSVASAFRRTTASTVSTMASTLTWTLPVLLSLVLAFQPAPAREDAYRANNLGIARLEQFDFPAAAEAFRRALQIAPGLTIARVNLAIALYHAGDLDAARREVEEARKAAPGLPQAVYLDGLIARAANRPGADAAFLRVLERDPSDVGAAVHLGQIYTQQQKYAEAIELFRRAARAEPYNVTAAYGLATALVRSGAGEEGTAAMERFQKLRDSGYATTFSQNYLEQGRYAVAIASTGAEPGLVETGVPAVSYAEVAADILPGPPATGTAATALFDFDGDGDLDLGAAAADGIRLFRNDRGKFSAARADAALAGLRSATGLVAGDFDNDGRTDLFVTSAERSRLFRQQPNGRLTDVTTSAGIPEGGASTAAWADADHDGDLDLLTSDRAEPRGPGGVEPSSTRATPSTRLLRNNGNGTFSDITAAAGIGADLRALAIVPTDYDNRRDIDFLLISSSAARPVLLRNMRDGSFSDVAADVGLSVSAAYSAAASGDVNKDGSVDFFFGRDRGRGMLAVSDGRGQFAAIEAGPTAPALAAQFVDYDNDGLLDLITVSARGVHVVRNVGTGWMDATERAFPLGVLAGSAAVADVQLASGDLDGDGDTDLVVRRGGALSVWRNDGGNANRSLRVRLQARVSNRSGVGARLEMRAGSLSQQVETTSATPAPAPADVVFGLGDRAAADAVRVLWPAGILQAETGGPTEPGGAPRSLVGTLTIQELDRKPSSCPYLFTWNGERFEFITDFLGGGEVGYWVAPGVRNTPDSDEYVRIDGRALQPRDGKYELRVTNELEEALFLDRAELVALAHPSDVDVYPSEGLGAPTRPFRLYTVRDPRPPVSAVDEHGHDVLDRVTRADRRYVDDFAVERIRGYAAPHALTLTLPAPRADGGLLLLLTGWTDYAFSRDNVAAHQAGLSLRPPSLEARLPNGSWRRVMDNIGVPVGRPQTVVVDLTQVLPPDVREVRIATTMRIYWDRVSVSGGQSHFSISGSGKSVTVPLPLKSVTVPLISADLRWRGFSAEDSPDGREPFGYDFARVSPLSPWKLMPGRYTREGDVRDLLLHVDDRFVVSRAGDEIALSFDATALPALAEGWTRTFLLYADGFSKEMDPHSSSPDQLGPMPFHGMSGYPYSAPEEYPWNAERRRDVERYSTRVVGRTIPRIEAAAPLCASAPPRLGALRSLCALDTTQKKP